MEPNDFTNWGHITLKLTFIHSSMERLNKVKGRRKRKKRIDNAKKKQRLRVKDIELKKVPLHV